MSKFNFIDYLKNKAFTEEDVKYAYVKEFDIPFSTRYKNDCRADNILFEFKKDRNFKSKKDFAKTLAQALYYVYRTKYGVVEDTIPSYIVLADINEASIIETEDMKEIYSDTSFDWERAPSSPDPNIINTIINNKYHKNIFIYNIQNENEYKSFKKKLESLLIDIDSIIDKKIVSDKNFEDVFVHWCNIIGASIDKEEKASYFIKDLQLSTFYDSRKGMVIFKFDNTIEEYPIPFKDYDHFWKLYKRPPTAKDMESIISKADRLNNMEKRRFNGQFYTPLRFAKLGLEYIEKELGENWYKEYKIYDMACGTGNLEYYIPTYENVYMSTIDEDEVKHLTDNNLFPGATIFQYDYLNDDVELVMSGADLLDDSLGWKLPRALREDLTNPENKWVVLINPPFGRPTNQGSKHKSGIANNDIENEIKESDNKNIKELYYQFLFRIGIEIPNVFLATYSTYAILKDLKGFNYKTGQEFKPFYLNGFIFDSKVFSGTKGGLAHCIYVMELY